MQKIKNDLEMDFMILHKWFHENHMVLNPDKCHYIVIGDDDPNQKIILNTNEITSSNEEKLLGILLDSKLNFDSHITSLCKKADQKLGALARNHYLTQNQKLLLLNSVVKSQFSYCPLIWMFTSRYLNNALNSYWLNKLAIEIYKLHASLAPPMVYLSAGKTITILEIFKN